MTIWWKRIGHYGRPHAMGIAAIAILTMAEVGLVVLMPWPMKLLVDYALTEEPLPEAVAWVGDLPGGQTSVGLIAWLAVAMVIIFAAVRLVAGVKAYLQVGVGDLEVLFNNWGPCGG